jgi:hypothetical protein
MTWGELLKQRKGLRMRQGCGPPLPGSSRFALTGSGELYPRVGFIVTNLSRPNRRVVSSTTAVGQRIRGSKKRKNAIRWTRLSCHAFRHNTVRLQLHALAYNLANFLRTLALPEEGRGR